MCGVESHLVLFVASCRRLQRELRFTTSCKICDSVVVADWPSTSRRQLAKHSDRALGQSGSRRQNCEPVCSAETHQKVAVTVGDKLPTRRTFAELSQNTVRAGCTARAERQPLAELRASSQRRDLPLREPGSLPLRSAMAELDIQTTLREYKNSKSRFENIETTAL